ncbi:MAG: sugar phosphate isomerase/epimerase family protein [Pirellulales bacterium]
MLIGYNTNGLAHHDPGGGLKLLADIGYRSVALTLDHGWCNPLSDRAAAQAAVIGQLLQALKLSSVVETGARFLLDPRQKHEPTLVSSDAAGRQRRLEFLRKAVDLAAQWNSDCVSLWSGVVHDNASENEVWERLVPPLRELLAYATQRGVALGFEPEPGMFIDTMARFEQLLEKVDGPMMKLTLDIGHLHCQGETPLASYIGRWGPRLVNVHIEDLRRGIHEHLPFGEGEIDFPPVLAALQSSGYRGGLHVELGRHGHMAPAAARQSFEFLSNLLG